MFCNKKGIFILTIFLSFCCWHLVKAQVNFTESAASTNNTTLQEGAVRDYELLLSQGSNLTCPSSNDKILLNEKHLQGSSASYGIAKVANQSLVSEVCLKDLQSFQRNILHKKTWAMKALDASGSKHAGFMFRNNIWLGSRATCAAVNEPTRLTLFKFNKRSMHSDLLDDVAPFKLAYHVVYIKHNSPWQLELNLSTESLLHLGLCLPVSCSSDEIQRLTQVLFQQKSLFFTELYDWRSEVLYVKDFKLKAEFYQRTSLKILIGLSIFTSAMMLSAAYLNVRKSRKASKTSVEPSFANTSVESSETSSGEAKVKIFVIKNFIKCFDIGANWQKLFATKPCISDDIPVVNGLRSVLAFGILFLHVFFFTMHKIQNFPFVLSFMETTLTQVGNVPLFMVDGFFTISGFLQTFNFLKNTKQIQEIRQNTLMQKFLEILFHRYLRLAPLYFVIMAASDLLWAYINDVSVFHISERYDLICEKTWWHSVFFIHGFFGLKDMCLNWSWSLSCEMQYFFVATILLFTYVRHPKLVKKSVLVLLASHILWSLFKGTSVKYQSAFEVAYHTIDDIYINSLVRAMPYILGSIAAWYFLEQQRVLNISPGIEKSLWNFAMLLIVATPYTSYWRDLHFFTSIALLMLGHCMISLAISWLILASATGRSTWWTRILEAPVFQHINRLTYAIYMLNPFMITLFESLNESSTHVNFTLGLLYDVGFAVLVYLASIVFSLAFEMPYCNWSSLMQKRNKAKNA